MLDCGLAPREAVKRLERIGLAPSDISGIIVTHEHHDHDVDMTGDGAYPKWLKERIPGPFGHLSNRQSEQMLAALDRSRLKHVLAAHLSQHNNRPDLAREALARAMGCTADWIGLATQEEGFAWRELR